MDQLKDELLKSKSLKYDDEISYINGFLYAFYYFKSGIDDIYTKIVELLSFERHPILPEINIDCILVFLIDEFNRYAELQKSSNSKKMFI